MGDAGAWRPRYGLCWRHQLSLGAKAKCATFSDSTSCSSKVHPRRLFNGQRPRSRRHRARRECARRHGHGEAECAGKLSLPHTIEVTSIWVAHRVGARFSAWKDRKIVLEVGCWIATRCVHWQFLFAPLSLSNINFLSVKLPYETMLNK
eukprot:384445-Pleurochrysis_carterae.AAC.1